MSNMEKPALTDQDPSVKAYKTQLQEIQGQVRRTLDLAMRRLDRAVRAAELPPRETLPSGVHE